MACAMQLRVDCLGGWSLVILALGAFVFLPATLFTGLYIKYTGDNSRADAKLRMLKESGGADATAGVPLQEIQDAHNYKVVGLTFFCLSVLLTSIGIGVCVMWMQRASARKAAERREKERKWQRTPYGKDMMANGDPGGQEEASYGCPPQAETRPPRVVIRNTPRIMYTTYQSMETTPNSESACDL